MRMRGHPQHLHRCVLVPRQPSPRTPAVHSAGTVIEYRKKSATGHRGGRSRAELHRASRLPFAGRCILFNPCARGSALPESGSSPIATADGDRDRDHGDQPPCTNPANCIDPMDAVPRGSFSLCIQSTRHPQGAQWFSPSPSPSFCLSPSPFLCKLNWYYYCDRQCC